MNKNTEKFENKNIGKRYKEFSERASGIIISDYIGNWNNLAYNLLHQENKFIYNGVILEAALTIMEMLSDLPLSVEEIFLPEDFVNPWAFSGQKLDDMQMFRAIKIIRQYHRRGKEFSDYRSKCIKNYHVGEKNNLRK